MIRNVFTFTLHQFDASLLYTSIHVFYKNKMLIDIDTNRKLNVSKGPNLHIKLISETNRITTF